MKPRYSHGMKLVSKFQLLAQDTPRALYIYIYIEQNDAACLAQKKGGN